jgi:hypothetical protein
MAISNTSVLIKRSTTTATPSSLKAGELAYSYVSNNFFIGTSDGTGTLPLGGYNTFTAVNNATNANTASTLVKRGTDGSFSGQLFGNANTATALQTARNFSVSGGDITASAQSFDGTNSVVLNASLNTIPGLTAGTYGSSTLIPILTVAANGRILSIANSGSSISTVSNFTLAGNTGSSSFYTGNTLTIQGGSSGIVTTETSVGGSATVTISTDTTIVRSNTTAVGPQVINTNLTLAQDLIVQGNLSILGTSTTLNTSSISVTDPMIILGANNYTSDTLDIGVVGHYNAGVNAHSGIIRDPNRKEWMFFQGYIPELTSNNLINIADPSFAYANVYASFFKGNVIANTITANTLTLSTALPIASGGTNNNTFTNNQITYFNGTSIVSLANTGTAGTYGAASYVPIITTDGFGRVSGVSNTQIAIDGAQITTGAVTVPRGGTGAGSFSTNGLIFGNGTGALQVTAAAGVSDQTWSNQILTVTNAGVPTWSTSLDGGTF